MRDSYREKGESMGSKKEGAVRKGKIEWGGEEERTVGACRVNKKGIEDYLKRGREEEEGDRIQAAEEEGAEWAFNKSRKIGRSPPVENRMSGIEELLRKMWEEMIIGLAEVNDRGKEIRKEMEELKKEIKERDEGLRERWDGVERRMDGMEKRVEELKEIKEGLGGIEKRIGELEKQKVGREGGSERGGRKEGRDMEERVREIEGKWERKEREERRRNAVIRGINLEGKEIEKTVVKLLKDIWVEGEMEWIRELGTRKEEGEGMALVRMKEGAGKRELMLKKNKLKGRRERVEDDLTFEERRMQWMIRRVAEQEQQKGKRVRVSNRGIWIEKEWWEWDEQEEALKGKGGIGGEKRESMGKEGAGEELQEGKKGKV